MEASIYIHEECNPLADALKHFIRYEGRFVVSDLSKSDLVISMAYHNRSDVSRMEGMKEILLDSIYENKKIIFLSWFDFPNQMYRYYDFINPGNKECIVMDASKYS